MNSGYFQPRIKMPPIVLIILLSLILNSCCMKGNVNITEDVNYVEETDDDIHNPHEHEHGEKHGHSKSVFVYSYSDTDPKGPHSWDNLTVLPTKENFESINFCSSGNWITPLNIDTKNVISAEVDDVEIYQDEKEHNTEEHKSLEIIITSNDIENLEWTFGHPADVYHGIEIRPPHLGIFQFNDQLEQIGKGYKDIEESVDSYTNYDFVYASIFYCDPDKASPTRSMHQIDGQRFPLEIELVFYNQPPKIGVGHYICGKENNVPNCIVATIITILGEFDKVDNLRLQPLIDAARIYEGPAFGSDDMDENYVIPITSPWSPTWLIPDSSTYYYYEMGTFPVPPCWTAARVYVIKEPIKISRKQFSILSSVQTKREPTTKGRMPCTYSVLRQQTNEDSKDVKYYQWPYVIVGDDRRPMTEKQIKSQEERERREKEKQRKINKRNGIADGMSHGIKSSSNIFLVGCFYLYTTINAVHFYS